MKSVTLLSLCFMTVSLFAESQKMEDVNRLMISPFRHVTMMESYGLRSLRVLSADELELEIGLSCASYYDKKESYRIVSFQDDYYSMYNFRMPEGIQVKRIQEAKGLPRTMFSSFDRIQVRLKLPKAMEDGKQYSVTAVEYDGVPMTYGRDWAVCFYHGDLAGKIERSGWNDRNMKVLGLRGIVSVGGGIVQVSFGPATAPGGIRNLNEYTFLRNGIPVVPEFIFARQAIDTYIPAKDGFKDIFRTDVFFKLSENLQNGDNIELSVSPELTSAWNRASLTFNDTMTVSSSFHIDKYGYLNNASVKTVYVANWMGRLPGIEGGALGLPVNLPYAKHLSLCLSSLPVYSVFIQGTNEKVASGILRKIETPKKVLGPETIDLPDENVYQIDISTLNKPGFYYVAVAGIGRSLPFQIKDLNFSNPGQLPSHERFMEMTRGNDFASENNVKAGKPWYTNLWSYNPYKPTRLTSWNELAGNPPPYGLDFGNAPVQIGGKPWYANLWSYNPHHISQKEIAWKHISVLTPPDSADHWIPSVQNGEKPWYANLWSYNPYAIRQQTGIALGNTVGPVSDNSRHPVEIPFYQKDIDRYEARCICEEESFCPLANKNSPKVEQQQYAP